MTTKTDYHSIMELKNTYTPKVQGIVSGSEAETINKVLEIKSRSNIELQNVRDMMVMLYSGWAGRAREEKNVSEAMTLMDAMSAICCVVDQEKFNRGMEI